jgi:hypothetical protein
MLVDLVLELDEPFRTTLVRHYFDGDTLADIARRDGIPEGTVRWRHNKAIERLRGRLDARSNGDRRAWIVVLAPVSTPVKIGVTTAVLGGLVANKLVIAAIVAIVGGIVWWKLPSRASTVAAMAAGSSSGAGAESGSTAPNVRAAPARVVKLASPGDRREIRSRIASVRASRGAIATPRPALPESAPELAPSLDKATIREAMHEVVPFLTQCFADALPTLGSDHLEIAAQLSLDGDRDIGTVIDAKQLHDATGKALPSVLDDCLRTTFQMLELPPLEEGDHVDVTYPFVFTK